MKLYFYKTEHDCYPEDSIKPQLALWWLYFNGSSKKQLERRNKYRLKSGFAKVLDEGCYFTAELWIGQFKLGFNLEVRPSKYEPGARP